jgi:AcrR family transcriptional regulator
MGYRGKLAEQQQARRLRRTGLPLAEIAARVGVSKSSVSLWVRDVEFDAPVVRTVRGRRRQPNALQRRRQAEIDRLLEEGRARVGRLSEREFLVAGVALYAGGAKGDGRIRFVNSDPRMVVFFCAWLRRFYEIDESRLRLALYLHQGLDLSAAMAFWSACTGIPESQFTKPYRAVPDQSIRRTKHVHGCITVGYSCSATHRSIMGLVGALLGDAVLPG